VNALAALYGAVVRTRNQFYDRGTLNIRRLRGPVVSIGNLTIGGSGKTPFLIALGELLQQRGVAFDVLSRGYGRATRGVALVNAQGSAREFGEEPLLIARRLGVPVVLGEDRYTAGLFAEQKFGPQLHLLDDGFQHRRLARDFDIVLITASDAQDSLLPAGRLREPLSSLSRADAILLTNDASAEGLPIADQQLWRASREIVAPVVEGSCFAFCGIARPGNFFADLASAGLTLAGTKSFNDHHAYTKSEIRKLLVLCERHGASAFVTTEKDAINLGPLISELTPLHVVPVQLRLQTPEAAIDALLSRIAAASAQHETI
jgi:tetraacyldisaccharide 4'-kinase